MVETIVVRTIRVKGEQQGVDALTGKLNELAGAQENVAVVSEQSARRSLSIERAYKSLVMQVDESARAQDRMARATKLADDAVRQGFASPEQAARNLDLLAQKLGLVDAAARKMVAGMSAAGDASAVASQRLVAGLSAAGKAADELAKAQAAVAAAGPGRLIAGMSAAGDVNAVASQRMLAGMAAGGQQAAQGIGLARHELINLSRQAQDIGVQLVSGQSPLMILAQQGTQIADIFVASGKSVGSFFTQAAGWAARFFTSTAGIVTGIGAIGAAAVYAAYQFSSSQKTVEEALEIQNKLLKEAKILWDERASAAEKASIAGKETLRYEIMRNQLDIQNKLNQSLAETVRLAERRAFTPSQVAGEMGEAPTGLAPSTVAGWKDVAEAVQRLQATIRDGKPNVKAFMDELARAAQVNPALQPFIDDMMKAARSSLDLANSFDLQAAALARLNGTATQAQNALLGLDESQKRANASANERLRDLQTENQLIRAGTEEERDRIRARQEYDRLITKVDSRTAGAIAAQMQSNARATRDLRDETVSWSVANDEAGASARRMEQSMMDAAVAAQQASRRMVDAARSASFAWRLPFAFSGFSPPGGPYIAGKTAWNDFTTQFNPAGYQSTSTATSSMLMGLTQTFGSGGFDPNTGKPNAQGMANVVNTYLAGGRSMTSYGWMQGGGVSGAIEGLLGANTGGRGLSSDTLQLVQTLTELLPEAQRASVMERELALLKAQPQTIETMQAIQQLTESLDQLKNSTDNLADTMTDVLSPLYGSDPRQTYIGFRAFAGGGVMTPHGPLPVHMYAGGGVAQAAQVSVFGEGSTPEAYVPIPSGRIPVQIEGSNDNARPIVVHVNMTSDVSRDNARRTGFQIAQSMKRALG